MNKPLLTDNPNYVAIFNININNRNLPATHAQLQNFGNIFCQTINEDYDHAEENRAWQIGDVYETDSFIAYQFIFGKIQKAAFEAKKIDWQSLKKIVFNTEVNSDADFSKEVRYYGSNEQYDFIWLIKPNAMRYWFGFVALCEADDVFRDYWEVGY